MVHQNKKQAVLRELGWRNKNRNTHHHSTVANTLINCSSILLPTEPQGSFYKQCIRNGWESENCATHHIYSIAQRKKEESQDWGQTQQMVNQRKNFQDQVDSCRQQIEKLQRQLLNIDVHCGHNTVSRGGFDKYDHTNSEIISNFCNKQLFPHYEFLHELWIE